MSRNSIDGVSWKIRPGFESQLDQVLEAPGRVIKESPAKLVTVAEGCVPECFLKRYRHDAVLFRPLKYWFKPSPARREWDLARTCEEKGIPIVRHLALGERWSLRGLRESILITEKFDGVPLSEWPGPDMNALLQFVGRMHDAGVLQRDLHPSNLLVQPVTGEIRLVDLYGIEVRSHLSDAERQANLAVLRIGFPVPVSSETEALSRRLRRKALAHRSRRAWKHNRDFFPIQAGNLRWHLRRTFLSQSVESVMADPDGFLSGRARLLKDGRSSTVGAGSGLVLKRANWSGWLSCVKNLFRRSRAAIAFRKAYHLELAGIPTARPIAVASLRKRGLLLRSYFLMEEIPGAVEFRHWKGDTAPAIERLAGLIARLHEEGFSHRDLKVTNIVFDAASRIYLIDLEGLEYMEKVPLPRAVSDLERLARSVGTCEQYSSLDWRRFLKRYCKARRMPPTSLRR